MSNELNAHSLGLLTVPEIAERLNVSRHWVYHRLRSGELEGGMVGRAWMVTEAGLGRWLVKHLTNQARET